MITYSPNEIQWNKYQNVDFQKYNDNDGDHNSQDKMKNFNLSSLIKFPRQK